MTLAPPLIDNPVLTSHDIELDSDPGDGRERLVVIGNGVAGARAVEEVLARDVDGRFAVRVFGEEPYGNYNRIMLSHVLAGEQTDDEIYLNPLDWYDAHGVTLHAGVRITRIDRFAKMVIAADGSATAYDKLVIATGSRAFIPDVPGMRTAGGALRSGVFAFRTIDDTRGMLDHAAPGRPWPAASRCRRHRRAQCRPPHERPAFARRRRDPAA